VRLAPGKHLAAEKLHLKLVRLREREKSGTQTLDDLFGVRYQGPKGEYAPGRVSDEARKKLPSAAAALTQQLALWLPDDSRLLWHLAELANAHGDVPTAAAIMDGCVTEFGMRDADLLERRKILRAAANEAREDQGAKKQHEAHAMPLLPRSSRPLAAKELTDLPPIDPKRPNALAWEVIGRTAVGRDGRPTFPKYLKDLDNLTVVLRGHMQPVNEDGLGAFLLIEHPVGCWYCEMPELQRMVMVEMPRGTSAQYTRDPVTVTGKLKLNATDPEKFLYFLTDAKVE
jgi:hypothetical protein